MLIASLVLTRISNFTGNRRKKLFMGKENQVNNPRKLVNCDICRAQVNHEYVRGLGHAWEVQGKTLGGEFVQTHAMYLLETIPRFGPLC